MRLYNTPQLIACTVSQLLTELRQPVLTVSPQPERMDNPPLGHMVNRQLERMASPPMGHMANPPLERTVNPPSNSSNVQWQPIVCMAPLLVLLTVN